MVRRVIRIAIFVWLVGAGVQWARRNRAAVGRMRGMVSGMAPGGRQAPSSKLQPARPSRAEAREQLIASAQREAATGAQDNVAQAPASSSTDDLKIVEGIGPRIDGVLRAAGVTTFEELAGLSPGRIETIIREAGMRMANPTTWPEQARLAASGQWDTLAELQAHLKGGRQVTSA